ncbi:ABC transporter ATP-binding protein [Microvirga tunisiensis]|uniref:ABC transporter ATP-binding protein n=1 Tax=Microvirga tunisiensis TaxID=2108360 RepID=A0A5N7MKF6_9HYPH|nr:ABC transporter ATP-binding protein [Microvirga tunisiensis]MPR08714.1 ABC transporter ATP-binding protein [Microvirga tunisiensis]MPR26919.1 ABC transporter ATP-binding protein [Microvirga tunisiensis]
MSTFIKLRNVSIDYPIYDAGSRSLKNAVLRSVGGSISSDYGRINIAALSNVSLTLKEGERLGVLGHNGAGKSTLLRVLAGVYEPTIGHAQISGRVSSLTDLTMGMDPDATGYENIYLRGIFLGMSRAEIQSKIPEIENFTELGEYLSLPMRTYSSGMFVRLAFAIATANLPDILIMDEMIGAGDANFAKKMSARSQEFVASSKIVVLASHDPATIRSVCTRAIRLSSGNIVQDGPVEEVLEAYLSSVLA